MAIELRHIWLDHWLSITVAPGVNEKVLVIRGRDTFEITFTDKLETKITLRKALAALEGK
jgi:hypothetical protein